MHGFTVTFETIHRQYIKRPQSCHGKMKKKNTSAREKKTFRTLLRFPYGHFMMTSEYSEDSYKKKSNTQTHNESMMIQTAKDKKKRGISTSWIESARWSQKNCFYNTKLLETNAQNINTNGITDTELDCASNEYVRCSCLRQWIFYRECSRQALLAPRFCFALTHIRWFAELSRVCVCLLRNEIHGIHCFGFWCDNDKSYMNE